MATSDINLTIFKTLPTPASNITTTTTINTTNINTTDVGLITYHISSHEEFISKQVLANFMAAFVWMMPALCVLAVTFCVLNAAVYWQQRAARFAWYLVAVDLGDGVCSLVELAHSVTSFALPSDAYAHVVMKWYLAKYFAASCRRAAVCLNAFASLERFLAIAFPLKSVSMRVCGKPLVVIASTFILSLGAHVYFALEFEVVRKETGEEGGGDGGGGGWELTHTAMRINDPKLFTLWSTVDSIIFAYSPLAMVMVLNVTLLAVLRMHTASLRGVRTARGGTAKQTGGGGPDNNSDAAASGMDREGVDSKVTGKSSTAESGSKRKRENQTTKMVMVFSTVFLLMALPRMLNSTARALVPDYGPKGKERNLYNAVGLLSQITSHLTETALFWVSFLYSRQFRRAVLRLPVARWLCGRWVQKTSLPVVTSSTSGDVSTTTKGTVWSTNESLRHGD